MAREYFCAYHSYLKQCKGLSDSELGRLFRALLEYSASGAVPELNGRESVAFDFMAANIDRDAEAYEKTCSQNRQNISKRYDRIRSNTNDTSVYESYQEKEEGKEELKKDISNEISKKSAARCSRPKNEGKPSYEELEAYCKEQGVNAEEVWDYYESNGWRVGKNPMKDWKAVVRNWKRRQFSGASTKRQEGPQKDYSFDLEAFEREHKWRVPDLPEGEG